MQTMKSIDDLIQQIKATPHCKVDPALGQPRPRPSLVVPPEVARFYELCGGAELFVGSDHPLSFVSPRRFRSANLEIVGEEIDDDISSTWCIFAQGRSGEYATIDLGAQRAGRCYDSYVDRHGVAGSCAVIAQTFCEFLERCLPANGDRYFWLNDRFFAYGDAYDSL
jgi:antitoxin YokJ